MDKIHQIFRNCITQAWSSLAGRQALKNQEINEDLLKYLPNEFSVKKQIENRMSCGESANRMCQILTGSTMGDIVSNANSVDLADDNKVQHALQSMRKMPGHILVRINIIGGGAGHAYIFLTVARMINDPLKGYIYQTNVGVSVSTAFNLKQWIDDCKSSEIVKLPDHLEELKELCGIGVDPIKKAPSRVYEKRFMQSNKPLTLKDGLELNKVVAYGGRSRVKFLWTPMTSKNIFFKNVIKIRTAATADTIKRRGKIV
jgi:hypothetical protein